MPVDKFGRMSDTKTKDTGVSLTYINNNYVRSDGGTPLTGSLDMRGNTIYNVADPVNPQDVVTKVYVDNTKGSGVIGRKIGDSVSIKENLDFLGKQKIKNLPDPVNDKDAATKEYVDNLQTQYIDKRGNIRFDRNINVGNNKIFALKDPKKDYEATNKKYVDESITKRLQEEKDKFLPQDPATKEYVDEAVKQLAGGDLLVSKEGVFIKTNGHYRATAPLDIDNQKVENIPDPVDEKDAVNRKYVDEIVENLTLKQGLLRENGGFNLVDSYINMNFNHIRNLGNPKHGADAVPRSFLDGVVKELEEEINKRKQLIAVQARYCGPLKEGDYPFKFVGNSFEKCEMLFEENYLKGLLSGFVMPHSGRIRKTICEGLAYINFDTIFDDIINSLNENEINNLKVYYKKEDFKDSFSHDLKNFNFNIYSNKPIQNEVSFFEIVKLEKFFGEPKRHMLYIEYILPKKEKVHQSVLLEKFDWIQIERDRVQEPDINQVKLVMRISNNENLGLLQEGDTINIRISNFQNDLFSEKNIRNNILKPAIMHLFSILNFNFTFLIELDPL